MDHYIQFPLVVLSKLTWCPERNDYVTTWHRVRLRRFRPREPQAFLNPWGEWCDMKREMAEVQKKDKKWTPPSEPLLKDCPILAQMLTDCWWDDGAPREPFTLMIRVAVDQVQVNVQDVPGRRSITTNADSISLALDLLEEALAAGKNLWRSWGGQRKR